MKTITDLCNEIAMNKGTMKTDNEAILEYQDIIGHSSEDENEKVSNGVLAEIFYRVYGEAYGTVAAIKYYLSHSDKLCDIQYELGEAKALNEKHKKRIEELEESYNTKVKQCCELETKLREAQQNLTVRERNLAGKDEEIIKLKAILWDMQNGASA